MSDSDFESLYLQTFYISSNAAATSTSNKELNFTVDECNRVVNRAGIFGSGSGSGSGRVRAEFGLEFLKKFRFDSGLNSHCYFIFHNHKI